MPSMKFFRTAAIPLLAASLLASASSDAVRRRIETDAGLGLPLVAHVVVALCDNENQGIVPVSRQLGNGQNPEGNLYWGARFGVRSHFLGAGRWRLAGKQKPKCKEVLETMIFSTKVIVGGKDRSLFLVAEAWDGRNLREAIVRFVTMASGNDAETITLKSGNNRQALDAGGYSHVVAFVGHNGLMDFPYPGTLPIPAGDKARSAVVLACASKPYFLEILLACRSHPLLLTTGLMAPEAYTLDAIIRTWFTGKQLRDVRDAAAEAYDRFQKCGIIAARRLFSIVM